MKKETHNLKKYTDANTFKQLEEIEKKNKQTKESHTNSQAQNIIVLLNLEGRKKKRKKQSSYNNHPICLQDP